MYLYFADRYLNSHSLLTNPSRRELEQLDVTQCLQLRERLARVKRLEASIASAAGIAMVFSSTDTTMSAQYLDLLVALAAAASDSGPLKEGGLVDLPLRVQPREERAAAEARRESREESGQDSRQEGYGVDVVSGLVSVPVDASAEDVLQYLKVMIHPPPPPLALALPFSSKKLYVHYHWHTFISKTVMAVHWVGDGNN